jgi:hypothetical protein
LPDPPDAVAASIRRLFEAWNAGNSAPVLPLQWPALESWRALVQAWRSRLAVQDDLTSQLQRFVTQTR